LTPHWLDRGGRERESKGEKSTKDELIFTSQREGGSFWTLMGTKNLPRGGEAKFVKVTTSRVSVSGKRDREGRER